MSEMSHIESVADEEAPIVTSLTGSSPPTGAAPVFEPIANLATSAAETEVTPDAELITQARLVEELSGREHAHFGREPPDGSSPEYDEWSTQAMTLAEEFRASIEQLAAMKPTTSAGLAAKGAAVLKMHSLLERIDWWQEADLVRGLAEDAVRLGALPVRLADQVDVPLAAAWAEYERLSPLLDRANAEIERLEQEAKRRFPERPDEMVIRPDDFPKSSIPFKTSEPSHAERQFYTDQAVEHLRRNPRIHLWKTWDVETGALLGSERRPDHAAQVRADEIIAAYDLWQGRCEAVRAELGLPEADQRASDLADSLYDLGCNIRDLEARSVRGVGIKAAWARTLVAEEDDRLQLVLEQIVRFAERCAAPVITGRAGGTSTAILSGMVERWVTLGLQIDEAERCGCGGNAQVRELRDDMRALADEIGSWPARSFRELLMKGLLFNTGVRLREKVEEDAAVERLGTDRLARSIALDVVELVGIAPQEWPFIGTLPAERPSIEALEAYRTWLSNEYRSLTAEMYPNQPEMTGAITLNNSGDKFHFRGEPPASTRAERMLTLLGLDWTEDRPSVLTTQRVAA